MNQSNNRENNVNGTGSSNGEGVTFGSGSGGQQPDLGRHQATARRNWNKEVNKIVMRCFYRSPDPVMVKVSRSAVVLGDSSQTSVVIKRLLEGTGIKKLTRL